MYKSLRLLALLTKQHTIWQRLTTVLEKLKVRILGFQVR